MNFFLHGYNNLIYMQLNVDQPNQYRPSLLHTSKIFFFPKSDLFQLARNSDINKKTKIPGQ